MKLLKTVCFSLLVGLLTSAQANSFDGVRPESIHSSEKEKILNFINAFPLKNYRVYHTKQPGYFYVDAIDDVIKNTLRHKAAWEPFMHKQIALYARPGTTAVDIGAHVGTYTVVMSRAVGPEGKVIAIEPQPKLFRELVLNMGLNKATNVDFYFAAAAEREGRIELSPLVPKNEGSTGLVGGTGEYVDLITLDSLNLENVGFIKIDTEWMENAVLDGAKQTIERNKPAIVIEIMGGFSYDLAPPEVKTRIEGTIKKLDSMGYAAYRITTHDYLALPK